VFELALRWLKAHAPAGDIALAPVHGDFRNGNLMVDERGLVAVLDWELAHLGDPMEDLGWLCVNSWRYGRIELPVGGFGTRAPLFDAYAAAGGVVDAQRVHYWEVFGTLKWGVICQSMAHAYFTGAERNVERIAIGRRASEAEIDLLALLAPRERKAA
jgi:aminoglycoside phosphotransferase (APT) family kinase protein